MDYTVVAERRTAAISMHDSSQVSERAWREAEIDGQNARDRGYSRVCSTPIRWASEEQAREVKRLFGFGAWIGRLSRALPE